MTRFPPARPGAITIISMAGVTNDASAIWISAFVASINWICTFIGLFLVERVGRRTLLLGSLAGVVLALGFLAVGFQLADVNSPPVDFEYEGPCSGFDNCGSCTNSQECGYCYVPIGKTDAMNGSCVEGDSDFASFGRCSEVNMTSSSDLLYAYDYCPTSTGWLVILGLCVYLFFFAPGMGPMPWTINSEIYPLWARSTGNSLATSTNWAFNLLVSMTFLSLTEAITKQGTFYLYMGIAFIGLVYFYCVVPETKGVTLEEMERVFRAPMFSKGVCCKQRDIRLSPSTSTSSLVNQE